MSRGSWASLVAGEATFLSGCSSWARCSGVSSLSFFFPVIFLGGTVFRGFDATTSSTFSAGDFTGVFGALLRALAFLVFVSFSSVFGEFWGFLVVFWADSANFGSILTDFFAFFFSAALSCFDFGVSGAFTSEMSGSLTPPRALPFGVPWSPWRLSAGINLSRVVQVVKAPMARRNWSFLISIISPGCREPISFTRSPTFAGDEVSFLIFFSCCFS